MNAKAQLIANGFSAAGVNVSDRIAVICENCIEKIIVFLAVCDQAFWTRTDFCSSTTAPALF
jgi:long-subunit acyl-CoA synthetase (AMP-forming)